MGAASKLLGRQSSLSYCAVEACPRATEGVSGVGSDRLRNGYCPRCSLHFDSWRLLNKTSDPGADRVTFNQFMTTWFAEQKRKAEVRAEKESREIDRLRRRGELPSPSAKVSTK
jgi:hypothetical protein